MKRGLILLFIAVALAASPPLERARPEAAPTSMSAGATALDETFSQEFAEERQPERVTFRYTNETWELDWEDWWAYRQGEVDLEGLVARIRIKAEGAVAAAPPVPTQATPVEPASDGLSIVWILGGLGFLVVLVAGTVVWVLTRKRRSGRSQPGQPLQNHLQSPPPLPVAVAAPFPTLLLFHSGPLAGRSVPLGQGIRLGRESDCHVVIEDASVSRHHAELVPSPQGWVLRDLGSSNGSTVNGARIQGEVLLRGDETLFFGVVGARLQAG